MGLRFMQRYQCGYDEKINETIVELQKIVVLELTWDFRVGDAYIQRVLMLVDSGAYDQVKPIWISRVLEVIKLMSQKRISIVDANILVLGLTFKEDCPDLSNTKVVDLLSELAPYNASVDVYDPWVSNEEAQHEYGLELVNKAEKGKYDAIIIAVSHHQFKQLGAEGLHALGKKITCFMTLNIFSRPVMLMGGCKIRRNAA